MDRANGLVFMVSYVLVFLASPVLYIGVVQAALCDKLGASAMVSNLPAAVYLLGSFAPFYLAMIVPHSLEVATVVWANTATAFLLVSVVVVLALPCPANIQIAVVVLVGLLMGCSESTSQVFTLQCLGRGTTIKGRSRAMKRTFTFAPLCAVAGSLGTQYVLDEKTSPLAYPHDFMVIYSVAAISMASVAYVTSRYRVIPVPEEPQPNFFRSVISTVQLCLNSRALLLLFAVYLMWNISLSATGNLALFTKMAIGRDPKDFAGLIMAIRFAGKALGGYLLGWLALRFGTRSSVIASIIMLMAAAIWALVVPGYGYLFSHAIQGAGELGGIYIPNYVIELSEPAMGARNLSLINLASPLSSFAPPVYGMLADRFGFRSSFVFAILTALAALALAGRIRKDHTSRK